jgi:hypothetical protein
MDDFLQRINQWYKPDGECWIWTGHLSKAGYGSLRYKGKRKPAHRMIYEVLIGEVPDGLELDHLCRRPACVNPKHMEPVTHRENMLRGNTFTKENLAKTHCVRNHPYNEENTYYEGRKRRCRKCSRIYAAKYRLTKPNR